MEDRGSRMWVRIMPIKVGRAWASLLVLLTVCLTYRHAIPMTNSMIESYFQLADSTYAQIFNRSSDQEFSPGNSNGVIDPPALGEALHPTNFTVGEVSNHHTNSHESLKGLVQYKTLPPPEGSLTSLSAQEERKAKQKFFAIHIGPSKTGTSAIQFDSSRHPEIVNALLADDTLYVGRSHFHSIALQDSVEGESKTKRANRDYKKAIKCSKSQLEDFDNVDGVVEDNDLRLALKEKIFECWPEKKRYLLDKNILDSDEAYSYRGGHFEKYLKMFDLLGYDRIILIAAYRRFADWLTSAYFQSLQAKNMCLDRLDWKARQQDCPSKQRFILSSLGIKEDNPNRFVLRFYRNIDLTIPAALSYFPKTEVKILNFFQQPKILNSSLATDFGNIYNSITTELYCEAIGENVLPTACAVSKSRQRRKLNNVTPEITSAIGRTDSYYYDDDDDQIRDDNFDHHRMLEGPKPKDSKLKNSKSPGAVMYQHIVAAAYRRGFLLPTDDELVEIKQAQMQCEGEWCSSSMQCIAVVETSKKNTKRSRKTSKKNTKRSRKTSKNRKFVKGGCKSEISSNVIGTNTSGIFNFADLLEFHSGELGLDWKTNLPLLCPSDMVLHNLLNKSLTFEQLVMPEFYASPLGKAEHERIFWENWVEQDKAFCWVDIDRLFQNATSWDEIVERMSIEWNS